MGSTEIGRQCEKVGEFEQSDVIQARDVDGVQTAQRLQHEFAVAREQVR